MTTTDTTPMEPFWREQPAPAPRNGERCGLLFYSAEYHWWEYPAEYVGDGPGFLAACARRHHLERLYPGLEFGIADRYGATAAMGGWEPDLVIFTRGDPRVAWVMVTEQAKERD